MFVSKKLVSGCFSLLYSLVLSLSVFDVRNICGITPLDTGEG